MTITDKRYPRCSKAKLLRDNNRNNQPTMSSLALYELLGERIYLRDLRAGKFELTPQSVERYLANKETQP